MIKLSYEQQIAFNSLSIIVGNALYALTVVLFLVPSGLITGGATGIALGINRALGLPVSGVLFVINMTMLTVGWVLLGRRFAIHHHCQHRAQPPVSGPVGAGVHRLCAHR